VHVPVLQAVVALQQRKYRDPQQNPFSQCPVGHCELLVQAAWQAAVDVPSMA
jgi:hypothetical protein